MFVYWIFSSLSKTLNKLKVSSTKAFQNAFFRHNFVMSIQFI